MFSHSLFRGRRRRLVTGLVALAGVVGLSACEPFAERTTLSGFGPPGAAQSGHAVAISRDGLTMAVGSPAGYDGNGFVTVFTRQSTSIDWVQERVIGPSTTATMGGFGHDVDLSADGNTLVVGIPYWDVSSGSQNNGRAAAYFRSEGEWSDPYLIKRNLSPAAGDQFGTSVAVSADGKRAVIGAPLVDDSGRTNIGRVSFFEFDGAVWRDKYTTLNQSPARAAGEKFGFAVDMNDAGTLALVGAPEHDGAVADAGLVAVMYRLGDGTWATYSWLIDQSASATSAGSEAPKFGSAVAISGDGRVVSVGARGEDVSGKNDSGAVSVYYDSVGDGSTWALRQRITQASEGARGGFSVGLDTDGSHLMIGAYGYNSYAGLASLWIYNGTKYAANAYKIETSAGSSGLGSAVAISGDGKVMAAGASLANNLTGLVRTFDQFTKPGKPTAVKGTAGDASALVEWTAPSDTGGLAPTYTVVATPGNLSCTTTSTSCLMSGLTNDTAYTFVVTPANGAGVGAASGASAAVTPKATIVVVPETGTGSTQSGNGNAQTGGGNIVENSGFGTVPSEPRDVKVVAGWKRATISWSVPVSNGGQEVQSYEVTATPGGQKCVTTTETSCVIKGLRAKKSYEFSVVAVNVIGASKEAVTEKFGLQPKVSLRGGPKASNLAAWQGIATGIGETTSMRLRGKVAKANCKIIDGRLYAKIAGTQCKVTVKSRYVKTLSRTIFIQTVRR